MTAEPEQIPAPEQPKVLSLEEILAADDLSERDIFIPQWKGAVRMRALSRAEVKRVYGDSTDKKGQSDSDEIEKRLVCWASVSPRITFGNYEALMKKNAGAVQLLVTGVMELSGLTPEALEEARDSFRD